MLAVARERCAAKFDSLRQDERATSWILKDWDILSVSENGQGEAELVLPGMGQRRADLVVSTLVLEHIPLATFFKAAAGLVKPGGRLLVTNMHGEMGEVSQAGFVDAHGVKVRGKSFAHGIKEMIEEARRYQFVLEGNMERGVEEADVAVLGQRARKWVRGPKVWCGGVWRKEDGSNNLPFSM